MKPGCCCQQTSKVAVSERSWIRTVRRALGWIVPSVALTAMPKCPLCLAAYVALFTGFGISLAAANFAWWSMAIACVAVLVYLGATTMRGFLKVR